MIGFVCVSQDFLSDVGLTWQTCQGNIEEMRLVIVKENCSFLPAPPKALLHHESANIYNRDGEQCSTLLDPGIQHHAKAVCLEEKG